MKIELADPERQLLEEIADPAMKRRDVALTYGLAIRGDQSRVDWPKVNRAITERWSMSALAWIKNFAWNPPCPNCSATLYTHHHTECPRYGTEPPWGPISGDWQLGRDDSVSLAKTDPPAAEPVDGEHQQGPDCPRCTKPTELRGDKRTPYCRICHQFVVGGNLGDCRARDDRGRLQRACTCEEFSLTGHHHEACPALDDR